MYNFISIGLGFWTLGGSNFQISHWLCEWLLQQCYALTCYTVIDLELMSYYETCTAWSKKNCTSIILALGTTFANVNRFKNYLTHCWLFNKCAAFWLQVVYNVSSWSQFCAYITELLQLLYCIQSVMSKGKELESMVPSFQTLHQNIITGSL